MTYKDSTQVALYGSWRYAAPYAHVARRILWHPSDRDDDLGFRLVSKP